MSDAFLEYREEFEAYRDDAMKEIKQISKAGAGTYSNDLCVCI